MKDFNDIERIFKREKRPFWALYNAKGKTVSNTTDEIMKISDEAERLSKSFKFLETVLEDEGDGVYRIQFRTSKNANKGQIEHPFTYGDDVEPIQSTSRSSDRAREPKVAGLSALGSIGGLEFITGLINNGRGEADRLREEKHSLQMELLEKKFQIGNLEAMVNAPAASDNGWSDIIKGVVQDHSDIILDRLLPEGEKRTKIAALKSNKKIEVETPRKRPRDRETEREAPTKAQNTEGSQSAKVRLTNVFEDLGQYFPDDNPLDTLERLAPIFEQLDDLFPNEDPLTVIEVVIKMAKSKSGKAMIVPMVQKELDKLAEEADDQNDDEEDEDDE